MISLSKVFNISIYAESLLLCDVSYLQVPHIRMEETPRDGALFCSQYSLRGKLMSIASLNLFYFNSLVKVNHDLRVQSKQRQIRTLEGSINEHKVAQVLVSSE